MNSIRAVTALFILLLLLSLAAPSTLLAQPAGDRTGLPTRDEVQRLPASQLLPRILDVKQEARRTVNPTLYFNSLIMEVKVYHDYGRYAEADSVLNDVFDDLETDGITVRMTEEQVNDLRYQYAWTLNYQLKYAEAFDVLMPLFEEDLDPKFESNILSLRATLFSNLGLFEEAIKDNLESIERLEQLNDRRALATAYNNLGLQNHEIGDYRTAIEHYETSLKLAEDLNNPTLLAGYYSNTGLSYTAIDSFEVAEQYFNQALDISRQTSNPLILAQSLLNIGTVFSGRLQDERALDYFQESMELSQTHKLRYGILLNSVNLALALHRLERYDEADTYFMLAESMLAETPAPFIQRTFDAVYELQLRVKGDTLMADQVKSRLQALEDSLYSAEQQRETLRLQAERKVRNTLAQNRQLTNTNRLLFLAVLGVLGVALAALTGFQKRNRKLQAEFQQFREKFNDQIAFEQRKQHIAPPKGRNLADSSMQTEEPWLTHQESRALAEADNLVLADIYRLVRKLMETEQVHHRPDCSVKLLTRLAGTNNRYLSEAIREFSGQNFNTFLNFYRIRDARALLASQDHARKTIAEIRNMVGYRSASTFFSAFQGFTGTTPRQFRLESLKAPRQDRQEVS